MRAAEAHRHTEPLGRADDDVCALLAGRRKQDEREEVSGHDGQPPTACTASVKG